jgi:probable phosphoglycerate mutase
VSDQLALDLPSDGRRERLDLWFDGASRGNGQAGARASIGGVVIDPDTGEVLAEVSEAIGEETNNVAEYRALLSTIEAAHAFGARTLRVHGDSALVVNQMQGKWKIKATHLLPIIKAVRSELGRYERVEFVHVPRAQNTAADALANAALDAVGS